MWATKELPQKEKDLSGTGAVVLIDICIPPIF